MIRERNFPPEPESIPRARRFVKEQLDGLPAETIDAIALMVSEVTTNVVRHARTAFVVRIDVQANDVCVEVDDKGAGQPRLQAPARLATSGRGLHIVAGLCEDWGVRRTAGGKTVWFRVSTRPTRDPVH